jgi:GntR family transcriptional regulator, galactonate operon transcriptional repressor
MNDQTNVRAAPLRFGPNRKRNLFAQVVEELGTRIVGGELEPEAAFPKEADLETQFGVSRSVIREAVKTLAAKGLLESRTRTGIKVLPATHWNLLDGEVLSWRYNAMRPLQFFNELFEIRLMIEPEAAALAAARATPAEIEEIETAFRAMVEASDANVPGIEADLRFHRGILAAGRNALLLQMGNLIGVGLSISHRFSRESFVIFLPQHKTVMDMIKERDAPGARAAMQRLLTETRDYMKDHIRDG